MSRRDSENNDFEEDVEENVKLSRELNEKLTNAFQKVLADPSLEAINAYKDLEKALLAQWSRDVFKNFSNNLTDAVRQGRNNAIEQLKRKGFEINPNSPEDISLLLTTMRTEMKQQLEKVSAGVAANSNKLISELIEAGILSKKKISRTSLETFKSYGIALFFDARGSRWSLSRYIDVMNTTALLSAQRKALFAESVNQGNDLIKIVHLGISRECEYCAPFTGKVLSITGKTPEYMSVYEASQTGHLFGVNCDHIGQLELAPDKEDDDNLIALTDKNLGAMQKRGFKLSEIKKKPYYEKPVA